MFSPCCLSLFTRYFFAISISPIAPLIFAIFRCMLFRRRFCHVTPPRLLRRLRFCYYYYAAFIFDFAVAADHTFWVVPFCRQMPRHF